MYQSNQTKCAEIKTLYYYNYIHTQRLRWGKDSIEYWCIMINSI